MQSAFGSKGRTAKGMGMDSTFERASASQRQSNSVAQPITDRKSNTSVQQEAEQNDVQAEHQS